MNQKEIGKRIKSIRESQGLTRKEFAKKLNVTERTVANYEQGQRGSNTKVLEKIANALGVSLAELIKEEVKDEKIKPFASETLYKGEKYTKELRMELVDLYFKKKKYNNIDNILNDVPIEVREYIDILKELLEKTEIYYDQINQKHIIEKRYYAEKAEIIDKIKKLVSDTPSTNDENK